MRPRPLNAVRAFEASARHLSFTRAAHELNVTQAAVSQQVRALEVRLGTPRFRRLPRGLGVTDEGRALLPVLSDAFGRIEAVLKQFEGGHFHDVLTVGVVGTFAVGWLMPRLEAFRETHAFVVLRLLTHDNLFDLASEGLDFAIRFGAGIWPATHNTLLLDAPLAALCAPTSPGVSRRPQTSRAKCCCARIARTMNGPLFDSSRLMVEAAVQGAGVALAPPVMFAREMQAGLLVQAFDIEVKTGSYWLTWLKSRRLSPGMRLFHDWILTEAATAPK